MLDLIGVTVLPNKYSIGGSGGEGEVVLLSDQRDLLQMARLKKFHPVIYGYNGLSTLTSNKLSFIGGGRSMDNNHQIIQTVHLAHTETLFQEAKTPVGRKLGVTNKHKGKFDGSVKTIHNSPHEVLYDKKKQLKIVLLLLLTYMYHRVVFILSNTVVCMEMDIRLT